MIRKLMQNIRYNYATRPKVLSNSTNKIKQILRTENVEKLEKIIRDGYGYRLIGEYSSNPKIRNLLKSVPFYMARIDMLHDAVTKGQLRDIQVLLNTTSPAYSQLKPKAENLVISKDNAGVGLLHKAVYYDYPEIIEWLVRNYPATIHVRDKLGRIPLHYTNSTLEPERIWKLLVEAGSNVNVEDVNGKTPRHYFNNNTGIHLPGKTRYFDLYNEEIIIKPSNIRIWIHDRDIDRLQQIIWEGQGEKLRSQTSNKPLMKKFLDGIPYIMVVIQKIHEAAIQDDINALITYCESPVPPVILTSKDTNGGTALHKASGLGNVKIVDYVLNKYPDAVHIRDNDGRIPIHYAASFKQEEIYKKLLKAGANEYVIDKLMDFGPTHV